MTIGAALFTILLAIGALWLVLGLWMNFSRGRAAGPPGY
jgi:hypothetical protein